MTRRERLERKQERRKEWAEKAEARSGTRLRAAREAVAGIPLGQPILVGHHSEKRHRADLARHDSRMRKGFEEKAKAEHHGTKANGLARQLATSIYSDDPDAIEALEAKVEKLEAQRANVKAINAAWRKAGKPKADDVAGWAKVAAVTGEEVARAARLTMARDFMDRAPYPPYVGTNLSGNIKRARERIKEVRDRQARAKAAAEAGGVAIQRFDEADCKPAPLDWCVVTFEDKPDRDILDELRAASFRWSDGSWRGPVSKLPASVERDQS